MSRSEMPPASDGSEAEGAMAHLTGDKAVLKAGEAFWAGYRAGKDFPQVLRDALAAAKEAAIVQHQAELARGGA